MFSILFDLFLVSQKRAIRQGLPLQPAASFRSWCWVSAFRSGKYELLPPIDVYAVFDRAREPAFASYVGLCTLGGRMCVRSEEAFLPGHTICCLNLGNGCIHACEQSCGVPSRVSSGSQVTFSVLLSDNYWKEKFG